MHRWQQNNGQRKVHPEPILLIQQIFYKMEAVDFLVYQKQQQEQLNRIEAAALSQKSVLTFEEACRFTGLSRSKMYKHTSANTVKFSKPFGKLVYFDRTELEKWMLQNPISTTNEIETQAQKYCMSNRKGGYK